MILPSRLTAFCLKSPGDNPEISGKSGVLIVLIRLISVGKVNILTKIVMTVMAATPMMLILTRVFDKIFYGTILSFREGNTG